MNDPRTSHFIWIAVIAAVAPTISSIAALIVSVRTTAQVAVVEKKIEQVHLATNSMKDALVASTRKQSLQEGRAAGVKEGRAASTKAARAEGEAAGIAQEKRRPFWK